MISALKKKLALYRKNRLVDSLAALSDEDAREVVRFARKGCHMAVNPPKGVPKKRRDIDKASEQGFEDYEERKENF